MVQWKKWAADGQLEKAHADIHKYMDLINLLFVEANPIPVKKALQLMGLLDSACFAFADGGARRGAH